MTVPAVKSPPTLALTTVPTIDYVSVNRDASVALISTDLVLVPDDTNDAKDLYVLTIR